MNVPAMSKEQKAMMDAMQKASEVRPEHKQLEAFAARYLAGGEHEDNFFRT